MLVVCQFFTTAADLLQITIAFVLNFFFSDKNNLLDVSTDIVGTQQCSMLQ